LATSITTWQQTKVEAEARDEEGAGGDDVKAGDEGAARDEDEAGDAKALAGDKEGDGAAARTGEDDEGTARARAEDEGEVGRPPKDRTRAPPCEPGRRERGSAAHAGAEDEPHATEPRMRTLAGRRRKTTWVPPWSRTRMRTRRAS
jgi:hypothetical protein